MRRSLRSPSIQRSFLRRCSSETFFVAHDPTQVGGQGHDIGPQYRSIVLLGEERQRSLLEGIMTEMEEGP